MRQINISRKDILWSYIAQISNIGANVLILPALFRHLSGETLGIWYIFLNVGTFVILFGLTFQTSFNRNISYAYSGATSLLKNGVASFDPLARGINYSLLKGLIVAMRRFYGLLALVIFIVLATFGAYYIYHVSNGLPHSHQVIYAWEIYAFSISLSFYFLYLGSLLQGRGLIKEFNQVLILSKVVYIVLVYILIEMDCGIWALPFSNLASLIILRVVGKPMSYKHNLAKSLQAIIASDSVSLMKVIWANTYKLTLSTLFVYLSTKGNLFFVSLFLPLEVVAEYGLTLQMINVLTTISMLYFYNLSPLVAQSWVTHDVNTIREVYAKSLVLLWVIFVGGGCAVLLTGNFILSFIGSNVSFLPTVPLFLLLLVYFLDTNHSLSLNLIVSQNCIPQLPASCISAIAIFIFIYISMSVFDWQIYGVICAVGVVQLCYQNWKWPLVVSHMLHLSLPLQLEMGRKIFLQKMHGG